MNGGINDSVNLTNLTEHAILVHLSIKIITIKTEMWSLQKHVPPGFEGCHRHAVLSPHSDTGGAPNLRVSGEKQETDLYVHGVASWLLHLLCSNKVSFPSTSSEFSYFKRKKRAKIKLSQIWSVATEGLTLHKCKTHGKPETAAPGLACPDQ